LERSYGIIYNRLKTSSFERISHPLYWTFGVPYGSVACPANFFRVVSSRNSYENRGQRGRESGGGSLHIPVLSVLIIYLFYETSAPRKNSYIIRVFGVRIGTTQMNSKMKHTSVTDPLELYLLTCLEDITKYIYITQCVHFLVCYSFCHISITLHIRTLTNWFSCGSGGSQDTRPRGVAMNIVWGGSTNLFEDR
jgi:hypothetical protein